PSGSGCKGKKRLSENKNFFSLYFPGLSLPERVAKVRTFSLSASTEANLFFQRFLFGSRQQIAAAACVIPSSRFPVPAEPGCKSSKHFPTRKRTPPNNPLFFATT
ncbi:hypothetical protein, partial [Pontibacter rugosus]